MATAIPANRVVFSLEEILRATGARRSGNSCKAGCVGVTTDSRDNVEGKLFVALSGERFDGHQYVADVLSRGAYAALVEREVSGVTGLLFSVPSTLTALGALAYAHRVRWGGTVITIGGSAGKTTTRSAVQTFLSALRPGKVCGTVGNLNNRVGVPMTLLTLESSHELAVVEVGTNQRGEVEQLSRICAANVALLTCIGLEHSEGLGDLDEIEKEEGDLFRYLADGAQVIGLVDDPRVVRLLARTGEQARWSYGQGIDATHRIIDRTPLNRECSRLSIARSRAESAKALQLRTRLCGLPGALASAAAVTVADALSIPIDEDVALGALDRQVGEVGRLRVLERSDRALIIDDCYNANPISMRSSFGVARELARIENRRLFFVLGDMRELGEHSTREHRALADELYGVAEIVAVGSEMPALVERAQELGYRVQHFVDADTAKHVVVNRVQPGDLVLIKGSRGVYLERVVTVLAGDEGRAP